jgi:hypothetical protein
LLHNNGFAAIPAVVKFVAPLLLPSANTLNELNRTMFVPSAYANPVPLPSVTDAYPSTPAAIADTIDAPPPAEISNANTDPAPRVTAPEPTVNVPPDPTVTRDAVPAVNVKFPNPSLPDVKFSTPPPSVVPETVPNAPPAKFNTPLLTTNAPVFVPPVPDNVHVPAPVFTNPPTPVCNAPANVPDPSPVSVKSYAPVTAPVPDKFKTPLPAEIAAAPASVNVPPYVFDPDKFVSAPGIAP